MPEGREEAVALRFWAKVDRGGPNDCWLWTATTRRGYGRFYVDRTQRGAGAHRVAYEFLVGPIPENMQLDHLCRVRACCNPAHMEPVTHAENVRRGESGKYLRDRTHCPQGHPYAGENLYVNPAGGRVCMTCTRASGVRHYARKRAEMTA